MYILTRDMRDDFINGLSTKKFPYAKTLPRKLIKVSTDIEFGAVNLYNSGTPFGRQPRMRGASAIARTLTPLVDKVWSYFNKMPAPTSQADFDKFHKELCNMFLTIFSAAGYTHTYGNAQKFVNVLFKYLACYDDSTNYNEWFKYCHMALDGFTYYGAYRLSFYRDVVYPAIHDHPAGTLTAWSKLKESEYINVISDIVAYVSAHPKTYNEYLDICTTFPILTHIPRLSPENDYVLTPFEAEFFIWTIAKSCMDKDSNKKYIYSNAFVKSIKERL